MNKSKAISVLVFFLSMSIVAMAQPGGSGGSGGSAPIDGGILALLAGIVGYGYKNYKGRTAK
jgi:hypothetical protein